MDLNFYSHPYQLCSLDQSPNFLNLGFIIREIKQSWSTWLVMRTKWEDLYEVPWNIKSESPVQTWGLLVLVCSIPVARQNSWPLALTTTSSRQAWCRVETGNRTLSHYFKICYEILPKLYKYQLGQCGCCTTFFPPHEPLFFVLNS